MSRTTELFTKLLAAEDLNVVIKPGARTASFDLASRTVTIPLYKGLDAAETITDGMIVHEVGHALYTPLVEALRLEWYKVVNKSIINIVEDARIEKAMKVNFRGATLILRELYKELMANDFFGIEGKDLDALSFPDRININAKAGVLANIKFNKEEEAILAKIDALPLDDSEETQLKVFELSKEVQAMLAKDLKSKEMEDDVQFETPASQDGTPDLEDDEEEQMEIDLPSGGDSEEESEDDEEMETSGGEATESEEEASDDVEAADVDGPSSSLSDDDIEDMADDIDDAVTTDDDLQSRLSEIADGDALYTGTSDFAKLTKATNVHYVEKAAEMSTLISDKIKKELISSKVICPVHMTKAFLKAGIAEFDVENDYRAHALRRADEEWPAMKSYATKIANQLTAEFKMKAQASELRRTRTHKTGVLNTNKLHEAGFNDDIFLSTEYVDDGENHGAVVLMDLSGSMTGRNLKATMKKALSLALFAKQNNVPFKILGYTTGGIINPNPWLREVTGYNVSMNNDLYHECDNLARAYKSGKVQVVEIANDSLNQKDILFMIKSFVKWNRVDLLNYGGTPFNEATALITPLLKRFKIERGIDKLSLTLMSDGETNGTEFYNGYYGRSRHLYKDEIGRTHEIGGGGRSTILQLSGVVEIVKKSVPGITVSYLIANTNANDIKNVIGWVPNADDEKVFPRYRSYSHLFSEVKPETIASFPNFKAFDKVIIENTDPYHRITDRITNPIRRASAALAIAGSEVKNGKIFARDLIDSIA